jgi:hypothetical protein
MVRLRIGLGFGLEMVWGIAMFGFLEWQPWMVVTAAIALALVPPLFMVWLVSRRFMQGFATSFAGTEPAIIGTVSLLFGLFAAFLANDIWTRNQIARQAVIEEADAIRNLARLAEGQKEEAVRALRDALTDYVVTVREKDWPLMAVGKRSLDILAKVRTISNLLITGPVGQSANSVVQSKMLDAFTHMREKRQVRTIMAENRTFTIKWHALILFAFLTQLAITITHLTKPRAMLLAHLVFGFALATCLSILVLNEFPFSALNPISSDPLRTAMESLTRG